jgi:hypothetical protein
MAGVVASAVVGGGLQEAAVALATHLGERPVRAHTRVWSGS